jgi:hypothetical protein
LMVPLWPPPFHLSEDSSILIIHPRGKWTQLVIGIPMDWSVHWKTELMALLTKTAFFVPSKISRNGSWASFAN